MDQFILDDLEPISVRVKLGGKSYVLHEASESAVCRWNNFKMASARFDPATGKFVGHGDIADSEPLLVGLCLFPEVSAATAAPAPVGADFVKKLRHKPVEKMFEWVKQVSGLNEDDTIESLDKQIAELTKRRNDLKLKGEPAKNGQGGGTASCGSATN